MVPQIFHSSSPEETSQQAKNRQQLGIDNIVHIHNSLPSSRKFYMIFVLIF